MEPQVPVQEQGARSDTASHQEFDTRDEAAAFYQIVWRRLLDVNQWKETSNGLSAAFRLTDREGNLKEGDPVVGDHFCISIPGPGNKAGDGFDWVQVEVVDRQDNVQDEDACTLVRVRPCESPISPSGTAHFFDSSATSTFLVRLSGNKVSAEVHGRNEKPNTEAPAVQDKVRNSLISTGAAAGMSAIQWKNLTDGLVDVKEKKGS